MQTSVAKSRQNTGVFPVFQEASGRGRKGEGRSGEQVPLSVMEVIEVTVDGSDGDFPERVASGGMGRLGNTQSRMWHRDSSSRSKG